MTVRKVSSTLFILLLLCPRLLHAQEVQLSERRKQILAEALEKADPLIGANAPQPFGSVVDLTAFSNLLAAWLADAMTEDSGRKAVYQKLFDLMEAKTDKQVGAASDTKGTTALVMKAAAPKILGFAVEHGGLYETVDGTIATFRGSPVGLIKTLQKEGFLDMFQDFKTDKVSRFFDGTSFAVSFDTSRGDSPGVLTAKKQQVASWSVRQEFINQRDPKNKAYFKEWQAVASGSNAYISAQTAMMGEFKKWPELVAWSAELSRRVDSQLDKPLQNKQIEVADARERFTKILMAEMPQLDMLANRPAAATAALEKYATELTKLLERRAEIRQLALKGQLLTADWTVSRDPNLPDLSTITVVYEASLGAKRLHDLTINATVSFFNKELTLPTTARHLRSYKLAGQYDIPLGNVEKTGTFILGFSGRLEHIPNDTKTPGVDATGVASATLKGTIKVFQAKLTIPVKGTGTKVPISFTAANRTELIKEKREIRANFGVTFDLDSIFAKAFAR